MQNNLPIGVSDFELDQPETGLCDFCNEIVSNDELVDDYGDTLCQECVGMKYE